MNRTPYRTMWIIACIVMCIWGTTVNAEVPDDAVSARVLRVIDGDTIVVALNGKKETIRMQGLDAPEIASDSKEKENNPLAYGLDFTQRIKQAMRQKGYAAKKFLSKQVKEQKEVRVQITGKDDKRSVGYVFQKNGRAPLGLKVVKAGHARVYTGRYDFRREAEYLRAQVTAMAARRGLWTLLEQCKKSPELFIGVHADARGHDRKNLNDEYVVIGNVSGKRRDLSGHILVDDANHDFLIPDDTVLESGESLLIRTGAGTDTNLLIHQNMGSPVWNNSGDTIFLLDPDGAVVMQMSYGR